MQVSPSQVRRLANVVRIPLRGCHFPGAASGLAAELRGLDEAFEERHVFLDFRNVESLASRDLGRLVGLDRRLRASGGRLTLCNVRPQLYEVFDRTGLTAWMEEPASR
jgi:anti-anti-sigma factor